MPEHVHLLMSEPQKRLPSAGVEGANMQVSSAIATRPSAEQTASAGLRIASVDFVRGVAMVLMAIDLVRVYSGFPAGGPTYGD